MCFRLGYNDDDDQRREERDVCFYRFLLSVNKWHLHLHWHVIMKQALNGSDEGRQGR